MRRLLGALLLALVPCLVHAADEAKPNTLTPKEVADGWLLLFDGETTFGWNLAGAAQVANGVLSLGGPVASAAECTTRFGKSELMFEYQSRGGTVKLRFDPSSERSSVDLPPSADWQAKGVVGIADRPITIRIDASAKASVQLRNIKLKPTGLQSIFNGKDLTGWKTIPTNRAPLAKISVRDGMLNIQHGRCDLQSEGQWADFVLQLECISRGQHLNSGVFFRCQPGQYSRGYECQIRNEFHPQADQKYLLEVHDPSTHQLKEKKPALFAAVDYGTGAIYNRQPARKQVARDQEWFTLTLAADGRHFASWVNGIQVTDWTDHRPLSDNARNGCRLEKGPISLQGHDPTTDLGFRSLRIAELPKSNEK